MIEQREIAIGDVKVPVIIEDGITYYPISYLSEKVLLRKSSIISSNSNEKDYMQHIKRFNIDMSFIGGGFQEAKFINLEGLREVSGKLRSGRLDKEQKKRMNILNKHINLKKKIPERGRFCSKPKDQYILQFSTFIQDCIKDSLQEDDNLKWQQCSKCGNLYPFHKNFFKINPSSPYLLDAFCRSCVKWDENRSRTYIRMSDQDSNNIFRNYGEEYYVIYREDNHIEIYNYCIENNISLPNKIQNKESYIKIIKYLYDEGILNKDNICSDYIRDNLSLSKISYVYSMFEVFQDLFGYDFYYYSWKYKNFKFGYGIKLTDEIAVKIFNNYIDEIRIEIKDVFSFDYEEIFKKIGLGTHAAKDMVGFLVKLNKYKYPAYMFPQTGLNYYSKKENRIFDLKCLIEGLNIPIEKIPLYLTVTTIKTSIGKSTMYGVLKKYYKNLFEWVNEVYSNKFIEADFVIGFIRNDFDSMEENQIHEILKESFANVIYNQRHTDNTITIGGYNPDWIMITDHGCWIVEYFGLYSERDHENTRVEMYMNKTKKKIEKYDKLEVYKKLYIYPDDLKNNNEGLINKIKSII